MNIDGIPTRTLRAHPEAGAIDIIDQTRLPHALHWLRIATLEAVTHAIRSMQVRGAPLIGATAACGLAIALADDVVFVADGRIAAHGTHDELLATTSAYRELVEAFEADRDRDGNAAPGRTPDDANSGVNGA